MEGLPECWVCIHRTALMGDAKWMLMECLIVLGVGFPWVKLTVWLALTSGLSGCGVWRQYADVPPIQTDFHGSVRRDIRQSNYIGQ